MNVNEELQVFGGFGGEVWTRRHIMDLGVRLTTLIHAVAVKSHQWFSPFIQLVFSF
ncbi:hypothetical protein M378DRAFT_171382, partial [Amanita muscaria Koide BX008]